MSPGAGVDAIAVLRDWHAALAVFRSEAQEALTAVAMDLHRATDWLAGQQHFWKHRIRTAEDEITRARAELTTRRYADFSGHDLDTTVQEENLRMAKNNLRDAEDQLERVRHWMRQLPGAIEDAYEGPARKLSFFLDIELERAMALLARQLDALDQYAAGPPPAPSSTPAVSAKEKS
jgi:hypothetical protein